jgi:hypothetical protein
MPAFTRTSCLASTREQRPGLAALLDYTRQGDVIVVAGIDRLGRNAAEVMTTIRELGERASFCVRFATVSTLRTRRGGLWPESWRASPSLSWSWAGNAAQRHARRDRHGDSIHRTPEGA